MSTPSSGLTPDSASMARICSVASIPLIPGRPTSMRMMRREGRNWRYFSTADSPSDATSTLKWMRWSAA